VAGHEAREAVEDRLGHEVIEDVDDHLALLVRFSRC
jgi:hypothetical protein